MIDGPRARSGSASPAGAYVRRQAHRSIVATFRRDSFLNFVYFTDLREPRPAPIVDSADARDRRPSAPTSTARQRIAAAARRDPVRHRTTSQRPAAHQRREPLVCGTPTFGRARSRTARQPDDRHDRGPRRYAPAHVAEPVHRLQRHAEINTPTTEFIAQREPLADAAESNQKLADVARRRRHLLHGQDDHPPQRHHDGRHQLQAAGTATTTTGVAVARQRRALRRQRHGTCHGEFADRRRLRRGARPAATSTSAGPTPSR